MRAGTSGSKRCRSQCHRPDTQRTADVDGDAVPTAPGSVRGSLQIKAPDRTLDNLPDRMRGAGHTSISPRRGGPGTAPRHTGQRGRVAAVCSLFPHHLVIQGESRVPIAHSVPPARRIVAGQCLGTPARTRTPWRKFPYELLLPHKSELPTPFRNRRRWHPLSRTRGPEGGSPPETPRASVLMGIFLIAPSGLMRSSGVRRFKARRSVCSWHDVVN